MIRLPEFGFEFGPAPPTPAVIVDASIVTREQLFDRFVLGLAFPDYFGRNWDAFLDCLSDLSWLTASEVVVDHVELPGLPRNQVSLYLECLVSVARRMEARDTRRLRFTFREDLQLDVLRLLPPKA